MTTDTRQGPFELDTRGRARIARELSEVLGELAVWRQTPAAASSFVRRLAEALAELGEQELGDLDPYAILALQRAGLGAQGALLIDDPEERRRRLRLRLEQLRQVLGELSDGEPVIDRRPARELARWLAGVVEVPQQRLADLLGVERRTLQRWISERETASPADRDAWRLRVVARIVNQLRHAFTPAGVIAWFERPREELAGRPPASLLDDPEALPELLALAARARSSSAS